MISAWKVLPAVSHRTAGRRWSTTTTRSTTTTTRLSAERRPWDIIRFVQQSSRFVVRNPFSSSTKRIIEPGQTLWKAGGGGNSNDFTFAPLDDVVMGGASSSTFDSFTGKWTGDVTDANNGGFIGIRSTPFVEYDMSKCQGIQLRIIVPSSSSSSSSNNNKGKTPFRLKVVLRDSIDFNGIGWTTSVDVSGSTKNQISFAKQVPTRFAKTVSGPSFARDQVRGLQLVFSKFEYDGALNPTFRVGRFQIQVEEIQAY